MFSLLKSVETGIFLMVQSLFDLKKREILLSVCLLQWIVGTCVCWKGMETAGEDVVLLFLTELLQAALPGLFLLMTAYLTGEVGGGDGLILISISPILGFWKQVGILFLACFFVILFGLGEEGMSWVQKRKRGEANGREKETGSKEYAFVPFLTVAYIVIWLGSCLL